MPESETPAAHPNARFTVPAGSARTIAPEWEVDVKGVLISARSSSAAASRFRRCRAGDRVLLDWNHGVSWATVAPRRPPPPRAGRRAAPRPVRQRCRSAATTWLNYMAHWIKVGADKDQAKLLKIYYVNWFRKNDAGKFVWPGFGENKAAS